MFSQFNQDKALIKNCIRGLTSYAAEYAAAKKCPDPLKDAQLTKICDLIEALQVYWGLSNRQDSRAKAEHNICQAQKKTVHPASTRLKIAAMHGLYRYAAEMVIAQGQDAIEDIKDVQDTMHILADHWQLDMNWVDGLCSQINLSLGNEEPSITQQL